MESNYQKLTVRQKSMQLAKNIYHCTSKFPSSEMYGLTSQMKRSVISIPSNIAEWNQRNTIKEHINFLYIAKWSAAELETQILLSKELWYLSPDKTKALNEDVKEILKMLSSFIHTLSAKN